MRAAALRFHSMAGIGDAFSRPRATAKRKKRASTGHASAAPHRCNRDLNDRFGSAGYDLEEVTVEILSSLILADLGIAHRPRPEHAAYIASWLDALKDPRAIFTAAAKAQQAADWMHAQQPLAPLPEPQSPARGRREEEEVWGFS